MMVSGIGFGQRPLEMVAHRGARTLADQRRMAPENTMPAFEEAAKYGAAIELDVIATRDGKLVVHHDDQTGRMYAIPGEDGFVKNMTYAQVRQARLNVAGHEETVKKMLGPGSNYTMDPAYAHTPLPTLEEVVDRLPDTHFYVEMKTTSNFSLNNRQIEKHVVDLIRRKNLYDRVTVISFNQPSLARVSMMDPKIRTGLDIEVGAVNRPVVALTLGVMKAFGLDAVLPEYGGVSPWLVKLAHGMNMKVLPWVYPETRDEEARIFPKLDALGVDGIITNAVDLLQDYVKTRSG